MILFSSQRLDFYKMSDEHFEDFCQMEMDPEVMSFYTSRPHGTREQAVAVYKKYTDYMTQFPELGAVMAFSKETKEFVGLGVLIHLELNSANDKHEVGYRLPTKSWGKGYATEMCLALIERGFNVLGFEEILGTTNPEHVVSQKVLMKCGLVKVGHSSNYGGSTVFRLSKSEWEKSKK